MTDTTETDRKRGSGARLVYDTLRDEILSLTLAPGETIDEAALAAGGTDEGQPGPRPDYGEPYYGCFVRDLDGHKIEAAYWDMELMYELYVEPHDHG